MAKQRRRQRKPTRPRGGGGGGAPDASPSRGNRFAQGQLKQGVDPNLDPGLQAMAEQSLGTDLDQVRIASSGRAEQRSAAAVTEGTEIDVHPATLDETGRPDPELVAHELVHVKQQDGSGDPRGGDAEGEARAGAQAVLSGQALEPQVSTGGAATPMNEDFLHWYQEAFSQTESGDLQRVAQTYVGSDEAVWEPDPSQPEHQTLQGTGTTRESVPGGGSRSTTTSEMTYGTDTEGRTTTSGSTEASEVSLTGLSRTDTTTLHDTTTHVDARATATSVQSALRDTASGMQGRIDALQAELDSVDTVIRDLTNPDSQVREGLTDDQAVARSGELNQRAMALYDEFLAVSEAQDMLLTAAEQVDEQNYAAYAEATETRVVARLREVGTTLQQSTSADLNVLAGTYASGSTTTETETQADGGSLTSTSGSTTTTTVGGGVGQQRVSTDTVAVQGEHPDDFESVSTQTTRGGGLVVGQDGEVGGQGSWGEQTTQVHGTGDDRRQTSDSVQTTAQLTTDAASLGRTREQQVVHGSGDDQTSETRRQEGQIGVGADGLTGSRASQVDRDHGAVSTRRRASGDGRFDVEVQPVTGAPGTYNLVLTVRVGAELSGRVGVDGETDATGTDTTGTANATANAGGSAQLVFTHLLTDAEATHYLDELDAAADGQSGSALPEMSLLNRMSAALDEMDASELGAASVVDADAARNLPAGDSYQLTLEAHAGGGVGGSGTHGSGSAGVDVGGSASRTRQVTVGSETIDGRRMSVVSVRFESADAWHAGGTMGYGAASGGGRYAESDTAGFGSTFHLDPELPDYASLYDRILGASNTQELQDLEEDEEVAAHLHGWRDTEGHTTEQDATLGIGPLGANLDIDSTFSSDVHHNEDDGLEGTVSGGRTYGGGLDVGGIGVHDDSTTGAATGSVDEHGTRIDLTRTDRSESVANLGADHSTGAPTGSWYERALAQAPRASVEREIRRTLTSVRGFTLDERSLQTVIGRASDHSNWSACPTERVRSAWFRLRSNLLDPQPEARWVEADPERAVMLAHCTAFAHFMEAAGPDGVTTMNHCLRNWGMRMGDHTREGGAAGLMFEWPAALLSHQIAYREVEEAHASCDSDTASWIASGAERAETGRAELLVHHRCALDLRNAITRCDTFRFPRAKLEMLDHLAEVMSDLYRCVQVLSATDQDASTAESEQVFDLRGLGQRRQLLESDLDTFKDEEQRLLARARDNDDEGHELARVEELHDYWIGRIVELRGVYQALEISDGWLVSRGPGETRNYHYEPEYLELNALREAERYNYDAEAESAARIRRYDSY